MRAIPLIGRANDIIAFLQTLTSPAPPELVRLQETLEKQVKATTPTAP
jgi:hypothetical protein